jgi:hypothetical protein
MMELDRLGAAARRAFVVLPDSISVTDSSTRR